MTVGGKNVHCFVSEAKKIVCIEAATPDIHATDLPEESEETKELCRRTLVKSSDPDKFYLVQVRGQLRDFFLSNYSHNELIFNFS